MDPSTLSWEDALALKYYETLFREFCVVNLKHYKHGAVRSPLPPSPPSRALTPRAHAQIALRWRTETEVLAGTAHLTCASMRCRYHVPPEKDEDLDPESTEPLVETTLTEYEVPFSYQEENEKKTALVKVVLCPECGEKLLYGRKKDKELNRERERSSAGQEVRREDDDDDGRGADRGASRAGEEDDSFTPSLPPDLAEERHRSRRRSSVEHQPSRRRSASPRRRLK